MPHDAPLVTEQFAPLESSHPGGKDPASYRCRVAIKASLVPGFAGRLMMAIKQLWFELPPLGGVGRSDAGAQHAARRRRTLHSGSFCQDTVQERSGDRILDP